jgi:hypothetical protein
MSVYIDMEMPKNCHECRLYEGDIYYCSAADKLIDISDSSEGKCRFCPLANVPPHGDLIDRDALLKKCEFVCTDDDEDIRAVRYSIIQNVPTVIPASEEASA